MTTEDLHIGLLCAIDDWVCQHGLPTRPGPAPACTDREVLTFALARELVGITSERRFRWMPPREWPYQFPHIPAQSEANRRIRWLSGALDCPVCHSPSPSGLLESARGNVPGSGAG